MQMCSDTTATNIIPLGTCANEVLFEPGEVVITPGAMAVIVTAGQGPQEFLARHLAGDWSEMAKEDQAANRDAMRRGGRIFSSYKTASGERVWVITEADRSVTTILLPSEY